ncbi:ABC transporter ATP-binding protein [Pseudonocardia abyssalis]|uniref:ABC transporter ATP-binding protein n=1 Tax=Pseudonocardia abyssalis TaxID=2792008 RepID=UPI001C4A455A|nr:ABC transporter ATP-binding protein [Pseudonocardia abyssalis]
MTLHLDHLTVGHRRGPAVLSGVSLDARPGELTALLGPNGAGKSTLLRTVAGLLPAVAGSVSLGGTDLPALAPAERARRVAVVLTERVDGGLLTARELVGLGRHPHTGARGTLRAADHAAVDDALAAVRAAEFADRRVGRLSDGERQRVLVARALAQAPDLLLLDEPTAFLDAPSRVSVTGLLRRLARDRGIVVVVSTHDVELALRVADRVWLLDRAGGVRTGAPADLVADGAVGAAFDSDELRFDPGAGTFVMR